MTFSLNTARKNARPSVLISVAAAAILALTSCSGAATQDASAEQSPAASTEQSAAAESTAAKAEETKAASSKEYTEAELTAILEGLKDADGNPITLVPAADLKQGQDLAKSSMESMTISPEACKAFANTNAELPEGSVYAAGTWTGDVTAGQMTAVTILSAMPQVLADTMDRASGDRGACSTFTMEIAGQSVKTTMKPVKVDTSAEKENGTLITQELPTGTNNTVTVEALQGGLLVSVVKMGGGADEAAAAELATLVDSILAAS